MNRVTKKLFFALVALVFCSPMYLAAQPGFGDDVNDSGAPLDGGLSVLAVAGAGYGLKKIKEARKKKKEANASEDSIEK